MSRLPVVGSDNNAWGTVLNAYLAEQVVTIGVSNGTDDASAIQALLTAARTAGGGYVRGTPGQHYKLGSSLVIGSGTTLDMTGCTVTENASVGDHLIQNYAWSAPAATASDGAVSSGSNVVTTSLGASAVAGQTLVVAGAGGGGHGVLCGQVLSATATTITLGRLRDGQALNATAAVSAASVKLYTRDNDITILGGVWNLGGNSPNPYPAILGIHVDNFRADIEGYTAVFPTGSRGVGVADIRSFWLRVPNISTTSVGVQVNGPAEGGRIEYVSGTCGDDLLAVTAGDYTVNANQITGDITNISIGTVEAISTSGKLLNIVAGSGWLVDGLKVTGELTGSGTAGLVFLGDDATDVGTVGGSYGEIDLGLINCVSTTSSPLNFSCPNADRITARVRHNNITGSLAVGIAGTSTTAVIKQLILSGSSTGSADEDWLYLNSASVTISSLVLDGVVAHDVPGGGWNMVNVDAGTITEAVLRDCQMVVSGQTQYAVLVGGGTVSRVRFAGGYYSGGAHMVNTHGQTGAITIIYDGCEVSGFGRLAQLSTASTVILASPQVDPISYEMIYVADTGSVVIEGAWTGADTAGLVARSAAQAIRVNGAALAVDPSILTPAAGDLYTDSNTGLLRETAGVADAEQFAALTASYTLANSTAAQQLFNATANGAFTAKAATTYYFETEFDITGLPGSAHTISFGLGGTATLTSVKYVADRLDSSTALSTAQAWTRQVVTGGSATALTAAGVTTTQFAAVIRGYIRVNAAGTLIPQVTMATNSAAAVVAADSWFRLIPVGSNTVASVGNWS